MPVQFKLYEDENPTGKEITPSNIAGLINDDLPRIFLIIHGFRDWDSEWVIEMKNKLMHLKIKRSKIITVNWKDYAKCDDDLQMDKFYQVAALHTTNTVAPKIKELLIKIKDRNPSIRCVGHSLGAQTCGALGRQLKKDKIAIKAIHGLDPAGPCFDRSFTVSVCEQGLINLNRNDAEFVSIIHTNPGGLGSSVS
jgi:hypothetical protein